MTNVQRAQSSWKHECRQLLTHLPESKEGAYQQNCCCLSVCLLHPQPDPPIRVDKVERNRNWALTDRTLAATTDSWLISGLVHKQHKHVPWVIHQGGQSLVQMCMQQRWIVFLAFYALMCPDPSLRITDSTDVLLVNNSMCSLVSHWPHAQAKISTTPHFIYTHTHAHKLQMHQQSRANWICLEDTEEYNQSGLFWFIAVCFLPLY